VGGGLGGGGVGGGGWGGGGVVGLWGGATRPWGHPVPGGKFLKRRARRKNVSNKRVGGDSSKEKEGDI